MVPANMTFEIWRNSRSKIPAARVTERKRADNERVTQPVKGSRGTISRYRNAGWEYKILSFADFKEFLGRASSLRHDDEQLSFATECEKHSK